MKKQILAYAAAALAALSCSSAGQLQTQVYDDGVYTRPSAIPAVDVAAVDSEVDNLLAESKQSPAYIVNSEGDTLVVPETKQLNITVVDTPAWLNEYSWAYRPWYFRNYWYYDSWAYWHDPWYDGYWRYRSPWYYNSWYSASWVYWHDPWYYNYWSPYYSYYRYYGPGYYYGYYGPGYYGYPYHHHHYGYGYALRPYQTHAYKENVPYSRGYWPKRNGQPFCCKVGVCCSYQEQFTQRYHQRI